MNIFSFLFRKGKRIFKIIFIFNTNCFILFKLKLILFTL
ncbi:MAG: hypothetical protein RI894_2304 [Bacteroidota bacterium]|jgi:hypothetical protein